ncbi:MAG: carbamate kinase [Acidobacteria bacterium]|nr:carbamate kinase [Acidobacteriota bacterium]
MRIVVALGGNAIQTREERGTASEERAAVREACEGLASLAASGHELIVTHGNGPQVGRLLLLNASAPRHVVPMPLDLLVAQTQGELGCVLQQELGPALARAGAARPVVAIVTQVLVDASDPAFLRPAKPVGPYLSDEEATALRRAGVAVGRAPRGGWRRLVASPRPREIVEEEALRALVAAGAVPVACGGGGVPVLREGEALRGVEAVVDKDRAAALLVRASGADLLLILTDVDHVFSGFGTPEARPLARLTVAEARGGLERGEFPAGSMGPKIEAAIEVVESGARAVITSLEAAAAAVEGRAGTSIGPM